MAANVNATTGTSSVVVDDWLVLQPLWDVVLANRQYTSSPLWLVFVANGFFFVCMIPYIILDFYGLDHWDWVKRFASDTFPCCVDVQYSGVNRKQIRLGKIAP